MKNLIKRIPILGPLGKQIYRTWINPPPALTTSEDYWINRYNEGGNSGDGSYNHLAQFKAEFLNDFVAKEGVETVIEFGCGDGNQLTLATYPNYTGFDVSPAAIEICSSKFAGDSTKSFKLMSDYTGQMADLTLSLDVIYHLVEDAVFADHMDQLFSSSSKYVIIYSSNHETKSLAPHVKHRKFSDWIDKNRPDWHLKAHIPNQYPFKGDSSTGSWSDFFVYSTESKKVRE